MLLLVRWDSVPFRGLEAPYALKGKLQEAPETVNVRLTARELNVHGLAFALHRT